MALGNFSPRAILGKLRARRDGSCVVAPGLWVDRVDKVDRGDKVDRVDGVDNYS